MDLLEDVSSFERAVVVFCLAMVMIEGKGLWWAGRLQDRNKERTKPTRKRMIPQLSANADVLPSPCKGRVF